MALTAVTVKTTADMALAAVVCVKIWGGRPPGSGHKFFFSLSQGHGAMHYPGGFLVAGLATLLYAGRHRSGVRVWDLEPGRMTRRAGNLGMGPTGIHLVTGAARVVSGCR